MKILKQGLEEAGILATETQHVQKKLHAKFCVNLCFRGKVLLRKREIVPKGFLWNFVPRNDELKSISHRSTEKVEC